MRVSFAATHSLDAAHTSGVNCGAGSGTLRCDDPLDLSGGGGIAAPIVQSDFILEDIDVQVWDGSPADWHTLRDYKLSYDQGGPTTIVDPLSGLNESTAGRLNLTRLTVIGDDNASTLPTTAFTYGQLNDYYEDSLLFPSPSTNCGPAWNTGTGSGCILWSQSRNSNSFYLTAVSNGIGLNQTFSWQDLRDNMHGVYGGGDNSDPFYCTNQQGNQGNHTSFPCNMPDDETWSRISLSQRTNQLIRLTQDGGNQTSTPVNGSTNYSYKLVYPLNAQECGTCVAGYSWGNQNDNDYLDFYNGIFMGFKQVSVGNPDGSVETHKFYSTEGWGLYNTGQVSCLENPPNPCHNSSWWDMSQIGIGQSNMLHGLEYELDRYDTNGTTLLEQVKTQYQKACPPAGVAKTPGVPPYDWSNNRVAEVDTPGNPVAVCDVQTLQVDDYTFDGATGTVPDKTTTYSYEPNPQSSCRTDTNPPPDPGSGEPIPGDPCYGRRLSLTIVSNDGGANGSSTTIVKKTQYVWNDNVAFSSTSASGQYLIDFAAFSDIESSGGTSNQCTYSYYDPATGYTLGQATTGNQTNLLSGDLSRVDRFTDCANRGTSTLIDTTSGYDVNGNQLWSNDADANANAGTHVGCTAGGGQHTNCTTFDTYFVALATQRTNALNQTTTTNFQAPAGASQDFGFGLWPMSVADLNTQQTSYTYDHLGRQTTVTRPGETQAHVTETDFYTVWCSGQSAQSPCAEIDRKLTLTYGGTFAYYRAFYDGMGHLVETRAPSPGGDVVQYYYYDSSQRTVFESLKYLVAAYNGDPGSGAAAYSIPDSTKAGTSYAYDGLGRTLTATDALSETTTNKYAVVCNANGTGDAACYEQQLSIDALSHQAGTLTDALGRINYEQRYTGNSQATYSLYATVKYTYDYVGELTKILDPNGSSSTNYTYDMAGRLTAMSDPDRGSETYSYDPNGNLTQSVDARGSSGTVFIGYDSLDRQLWRSIHPDGSGPYDTYSYDDVTNGNVGKGRLTGETFSGAGMTGGYVYVYDSRGRQTSSTLTINSTPYSVTTTYDDADAVLTQRYPDQETVTNTYGTGDWLTKVTTSQGYSTLLRNAAYAGNGGPNGLMTSAGLGDTGFG
ncbi:MAG: RHS repeat protein, partial [Chloroflexi bacterium]